MANQQHPSAPLFSNLKDWLKKLSLTDKILIAIFIFICIFYLAYFFRKEVPKNKGYFDDRHIPILKRLDLMTPSTRFDEETIHDKDPVFISAWSSDHFSEGMILCQSLKDYEELSQERKKLIVYDMGLSADEVKECQKKFGSMVEFRKFQFSDYPSYVRDLVTNRWKPLIIAEMLLEFPVIWWVDSSITLTNDKKRSFRALQLSIKNAARRHMSFGIFNGADHSVFAATHPAIYDYFPVKVEAAKKLAMADASHMLWFSTVETKETLLKWFVWCALDENCMAPPGTKIECDFHPTDRFAQYANCHRFDHSVISLLATFMVRYESSSAHTPYFVEQYLLDRKISPFSKDISEQKSADSWNSINQLSGSLNIEKTDENSVDGEGQVELLDDEQMHEDL